MVRVRRISIDHSFQQATQLETAISKVRAVNARSKTSTWRVAFKLLHTRDGIPVERIDQVLRWYCQELTQGGDLISNGNPNYIPIAYTGQKFRQKFDGLEAAMHKRGGAQPVTPKKRHTGVVVIPGKAVLDW